MANEVEYTYGSQQVLEDSGASAASDAYVAADDASLGSATHLNYPHGDFVLTCNFAAGVGASKQVLLYRQDLNIDGTNDAPAPSAGCPHRLVGAFQIPSGTSASTSYPCPNVPLTKECQFSIQNKTDQSIVAGWDLKVTPKTVVPGA